MARKLPALAALLLVLAAPPGRAEDEPPAASARDAQARDLDEARRRLEAAQAARARLDAEAKALAADRAALVEALLRAGEDARAAEARVAVGERRLRDLDGVEGALRASLEGRRALVAEVLASLQRLGRRPPPAVLARPDDVREAVRSAILLGAVVPELRAEAEALAGDLDDLARTRAALKAERELQGTALAGLAAERDRLDALVRARQARLGEAEAAARDEAARARDLAARVKDLGELLERSEAEIAGARRAAEAARRAEEVQARAQREAFAAAAAKDPARLTPRVPFAEARGLSPLPVAGEKLRAYGDADGLGGTARGLSIGARPGASVSAPCDGWVAFAGPFRSYGRLLIINAGGGYHVVLAGVGRIDVEVGQFVVAGEPVAAMGEDNVIGSAAGAPASTTPVLYVEFRKDGAAVDPTPWWATSEARKVRG